MGRRLLLERLPRLLTEGRRFVVWKAEPRDGKPTKVPYQPRRFHSRASVTDAGTWATFAEAKEVLSVGGFEGLGRVLGDGLTVIDLDGCRNARTGRLTPRARWVLRLLDSYTEVSPSGTGLHVWVYGTLPEGRRRTGAWIETYDTGRYMSLTGDHVPGSRDSVEKRVAELALLHADVFGRTPSAGSVLSDSDLLGMAASASNGEDFSRLFAGELDGHDGDHSAADLALCNHLAFWTRKNRPQMDRLFRVSGLMRPKWDQLRGAHTYGDVTLDRSIADCQNAFGEDNAGSTGQVHSRREPRSTTQDQQQKDGAARDSQATQLVRLAIEAGAEFFPDEDRRAYVALPQDGHHEVHVLRSQALRAWLTGLFFERTGKAPGGQAFADAINVFEAQALRASTRVVAVRLARHGDSILLDLGDHDWRVVEIDAKGWTVRQRSPIPFRRPRGMRALPVPVPGQGIGGLRPFLNLRDDADFVLVLGFLLGAFRALKPYPILVVNGEHGSAKSTLTALLRELCDPNTAPLRSEPTEARDLMIAASNSHLLSFDNLSSVRLADELSRLATGAGFSTRTLYENREEELFSAARPIILNGIPELITKPDLASRSIFITTPAIDDRARRTESEFWGSFNRALPSLMGALLDLVSTAIANEASVSLPRSPRLADFARWVTAAEVACPWPQGSFLRAYTRNQRTAVDDAVDGDILADTVLTLAPWSGTATELLDIVQKRASDEQRRRRDWFRNGRQLRDSLQRLAPALRALGVQVTFGQRDNSPKRNRLVLLERLPLTVSTSSEPSEPSDPPPDPPIPDGRASNHSDDGQASASARATAVSTAMDSVDSLDAQIRIRSNAFASADSTEVRHAQQSATSPEQQR